MSNGEKFKASFSRLSAVAGSFLPPGFKDAMIEMAFEVDRLKAEIQQLKEKGVTNE